MVEETKAVKKFAQATGQPAQSVFKTRPDFIHQPHCIVAAPRHEKWSQVEGEREEELLPWALNSGIYLDFISLFIFFATMC